MPTIDIRGGCRPIIKKRIATAATSSAERNAQIESMYYTLYTFYRLNDLPMPKTLILTLEGEDISG